MSRYKKIIQIRENSQCVKYTDCVIYDTQTDTIYDCTDPAVTGLTESLGMTGHEIIATGDTWSPPADVTSFAVRVTGAGGSISGDTYDNGGTMIDSFGNLEPLADGETTSWTFQEGSDTIPLVTAGNREIKITYVVE